MVFVRNFSTVAFVFFLTMMQLVNARPWGAWNYVNAEIPDESSGLSAIPEPTPSLSPIIDAATYTIASDSIIPTSTSTPPIPNVDQESSSSSPESSAASTSSVASLTDVSSSSSPAPSPSPSPSSSASPSGSAIPQSNGAHQTFQATGMVVASFLAISCLLY